MIVFTGTPVMPAEIFMLVDPPVSRDVMTPVGTLKYMIIFSPGFNDVGPLACCRHKDGFEPLPSKSILMIDDDGVQGFVNNVLSVIIPLLCVILVMIYDD
jgi:hypothetical protein